MSEQERQDRIDEALVLLGRMMPEALQAGRDELFFRAGEASARGELAGSSFTRRFAWPAIAATLAFVAAVLGYSVVNQQPKLEVVYVERPAAPTKNDTSGTANRAPSHAPDQASLSNEAAAWRFAQNPARLLPQSDIIHRQDWAALSDAFVEQSRLQYERAEGNRRVAMTHGHQADDYDSSKSRRAEPATYLELRDALRAM
ncbi:MAG: hypothetical protein WD894_00360 [Pirellulales bacterium]